jgi:DNA-directed RNA polymerase specialized sigma24 family protein
MVSALTAWQLSRLREPALAESTVESAAVTGRSEANVKQRLHRARVMLRRRLEQT